jgi:O-antigen/teichoic acid export membrane protein
MNRGDETQSAIAALDSGCGSEVHTRLRRTGIVAGRNSLFTVLAQAGGKVASLLLFLALVRRLTVAEIGQFSFALTFVGIFGLLSDWGISTWMMREVARHRGDASRWFSAALCAKSLTFIVSATAGLIIAWVTKVSPGAWSVIPILFLAMAPDVLAQTMGYLFLAFERGGASALVTGLTDWLRLGCVYLALRAVPDLPHVAWAYLLATSVPPLLFSFLLARHGVKLTRPSLDNLKTAVRGGIPFLLVGVFIRVYLRADTLLLAYLKTDFSVGTYNAAYKLTEALMFIPAAFMGAIFPLLSRNFGRDMDQFRAGCRTAIRVLSTMGLPLAVGTTLIAPQVIARLYGPQYGSSVLYLRILIWATALIFVNATLPASLNASGKEKCTLAVVAAGILLNVAGNLVLIPLLDALGAAIMTVVTEAFSTLLYFYFFRRFLFGPGIPGLIWRPLLASVLMGFAVFRVLSLPLLVVIGVGVLSYGLCLTAIGGIRRRELELAMAVFGVKRP